MVDQQKSKHFSKGDWQCCQQCRICNKRHFLFFKTSFLFQPCKCGYVHEMCLWVQFLKQKANLEFKQMTYTCVSCKEIISVKAKQSLSPRDLYCNEVCQIFTFIILHLTILGVIIALFFLNQQEYGGFYLVIFSIYFSLMCVKVYRQLFKTSFFRRQNNQDSMEDNQGSKVQHTEQRMDG